MKTTKKYSKLKVNGNNIETFCPLFHGFYGSFWEEPDFYGEAEHYGLPEKFDFWSYINWTEYHEALSISICSTVNDLLSDYIENIEYQSLSSPKYYNFSNDSINCIIRPKKQAIKDYVYSHKAEFEQYLKDHLKSRDGFISSHSWDFEEWEQDTKKFTHFDKKNDSQGFNLGFVLNFICDTEQIEQAELYYGTENVYISEFFNSEFDEIVNGKINEIKPFINEMYTKVSNDELIEMVRLKYEDEDTLSIILDTAKNVITEIESNTMKLELK